MKKIIFFSKNLNIGGMEKALVNLLNSLTEYYDVTLVLEEKNGILIDDVDSRINIQEYRLSSNKNIFFRKLNNFVKRCIWSFKHFKKYDFSCNYATYSVIGSRLAQIASNNSSFYIHSDYYGVYNKNVNLIENFFKPHKISKYNKLIFVSNESMNNFEKVFPEFVNKCLVINNLVDYKNIKKLSELKLDVSIDKKNTNFIFIGRLDNSSKNFDLLLDSFKKSIVKKNSIHLYIIGSGPYRDFIEKYIDKNNLANNIHLISETKNPYNYLAKCDALILTSNYEGFPVVYLEALVLNKKIFATIMTSDESLDMSKYAIHLKKDSNDISEKLINYNKEEVKLEIDFEKLNHLKVEMIRDLIEVR